MYITRIHLRQTFNKIILTLTICETLFSLLFYPIPSHPIPDYLILSYPTLFYISPFFFKNFHVGVTYYTDLMTHLVGANLVQNILQCTGELPQQRIVLPQM